MIVDVVRYIADSLKVENEALMLSCFIQFSLINDCQISQCSLILIAQSFILCSTNQILRDPKPC